MNQEFLQKVQADNPNMDFLVTVSAPVDGKPSVVLHSCATKNTHFNTSTDTRLMLLKHAFTVASETR
jgi:hypothetical protein